MDTLEMDTTESEENEASGVNETAETSLLTRNEDFALSEAGDASEETKEENQDPNAIVPEKPEEYNLDFSHDVQVDDVLLKNFTATAHELGISQGQAQKLAELYANHTLDSSKKAQEAQVASLMQAKRDWEEEIESRPHFQQEVVDARRTLKEFGSSELNEIMDSSLLGSHPIFFDFIVKVGKALAEPEARGVGFAGGKEKPLMDRLWPDMK